MMDERQVRLLVVLSAATIAVALIYLFVPTATPDLPWDQRATEPVLSVDPGRVVGLSVTQQGKDELILEKRGETWAMLSPVQELADPRRVEAALARLSKLELGVPVQGETADAMGLGDPPRGRVVVTMDGGATQRIDLGTVAPVGFQTYARTPAGVLVVVPGHLDRDVLLDPWTFRDAAVFSFDPSAFSALELESPQGSLVVRRDAGDVFRLAVRPGDSTAPAVPVSRADGEAVENLILALLDLRLDAFLDNAAPGGIVDPPHRVSVSLRTGEVQEVSFGAELPMGRLVQTARGSQGSILPERLAFLQMGPTDLADSTAFPLKSSRIGAIDVSIDGRSTRLTSKPAGWSATGLDAASSAALYRVLRGVGVDRRARVDPATFGAQSGRVRAELGQDGVRLIHLGATVDGHRLAKDAGGGLPYAIPEVEIAALFTLLPE